MYSLVSFIPLDITDESSIDDVLGAIDASLQFGEDQEVRVPEDISEDRGNDLDFSSSQS
jgi:hypothetical protein